jgi:hypothetical protein
MVVLILVGCDSGTVRGVRDSATSQAPATPAQPSPCGGTTITDSSVGFLRLGQSVADVSARCTIARDTTRPGAEGQSSRVLEVDFGDATIEAEVVDDRVWRIGIESPRFRTSDSLGVGTEVPQLLAQRGARPVSGEGRVFITTAAHCGLSFQLSVADTGTAAGRWTIDALRRPGGDTRVTRVLVIGCAR